MTSSVKQFFGSDPTPANAGDIAGNKFVAVSSSDTTSGNTLWCVCCIANFASNVITGVQDPINGPWTKLDQLDARSVGVNDALSVASYYFPNAAVIPAGFKGTATGGSTLTIVCTGAGWSTNQWAGKKVYNLGNGDIVRQVLSNTSDTITLTTTAFSTNNGDLFVVGGWVEIDVSGFDDYNASFVAEIQGVGTSPLLGHNATQNSYTSGTNNDISGNAAMGSSPAIILGFSIASENLSSVPGTGSGNTSLTTVWKWDQAQFNARVQYRNAASPGTAGSNFNALSSDFYQTLMVGFADGGGGSNTTITPTQGAVAFAGAAILMALAIPPSAGAAAFQGYTPTLIRTSPAVSPLTGALAFSGNSSPLGIADVIPVGSGAFTGQAPTLSTSSSRILTPASGALTLTGASAAQGFTNTPGVGSLTAAGQSPNVSLNTSGGALTPGQADMAFMGYVSPQILTLPPLPAGSASFQGYAPSTGGNAILTPTTAALAFQGYVPLFGIQAQAGSLSFQGQIPTIGTGGGTTSAAGAISFGGLAPIVTAQVALTTSVGAGTFAGVAPTLVRSNFVVPGSLSFQGYSPALQGASNQYRFGMLFPLDANGRVPTVPVAQGQTPYTSVSGVLLDAIGRVVVGQGIEPPVYHDSLEMDTGYLVITTSPVLPLSTESGLQYDANGALYVVYGGTTVSWQNGLPFDGNGALVVD